MDHETPNAVIDGSGHSATVEAQKVASQKVSSEPQKEVHDGPRLSEPPKPSDPFVLKSMTQIPMTERYEESWMHRGVPTNVACSPVGSSEFILTGSDDGRIKLWRSTALTHTSKKSKGAIASEKVVMESARQGVCVEFVKDFQAHHGAIQQIVISSDGTYAASIGVDEKLVKVFNLRTFDLFAVRKLPFVPACIQIVDKHCPEDSWLIVGDKSSNVVSVFNLISDPTVVIEHVSNDINNFEDDDVVCATFGGSSHGSIHMDTSMRSELQNALHPRPKTDEPADTTNTKRPTPEGGLQLMGENKKRKELEDELNQKKEAVAKGIGTAKVIWTLNRHNGPVHKIAYISKLRLLVTADRFGGLEVWPVSLFDEETAAPSPGVLEWTSKLSTDLFVCMKEKTYIRSLTTSHQQGGLIAAMCGDNKVRIWRVRDGKMIKEIDETIRTITMNQMEASGPNAWRKIDNFDFGRRVGVEKDLLKDFLETPSAKPIKNFPTTDTYESIQLDESGSFLIYPNLEGLKVIHWAKDELVGIIGRGEQLRFMNFALFQPPPMITKNTKLEGRPDVVDNPFSLDKRRCILVACALNKRRFFIFSHLEPLEQSFVVGSAESRDHLNEAPTKEEREIGVQRAKEKLRLRFGSGFATIHTSKGDVRVQLNMEQTPKTVENFVGHARNRYYNGLVFHRVIKGFMIQTGCPYGKGTGGESIWGGQFEDEILPELKHDRPYMVSMANAGPGTNGSQFFITMVPCPHLDGKHTIFGKVVEGFDVCHAIENLTTNREDRPYEDVKMISIKIEE